MTTEDPRRTSYRPIPKIPTRPRKVRGGVRLVDVPIASPGAWLARRWLGILSPLVGPARLAEGQTYAAQGQTRTLVIEPGRAVASVQGRADRPYDITLTFAAFTHDRWERVVEILSANPAHAARLFAGELPMAAEELLEANALALLPLADEVRSSCTCSDDQPGCKHVACVWLLIGERLAKDPFLVFTIRGLLEGDLIERLRARRAISAGLRASPPVYAQHVPGASDFQAPPLSPVAFWTSPPLDDLDIPIEPPEVSSPLLRRLGASPFPGGSFPLIGLLATCYEIASRDALRDPASG